jgi:hypothetical protein
MQKSIVRVLVVTLAASLSGVPALASSVQTPPAQTQAAPPAGERPQAAVQFDASLDRIREALARDSSLKLDGAQRRFYLQVVAKTPTIYDYLAKKDLLHGPVPRAQMTHQEYVQMITPKEMYSGVGIRPHEVLEFAITSFLISTLVKRGAERLAAASTERERRRIQAQIDQELEALERARRRKKD